MALLALGLTVGLPLAVPAAADPTEGLATLKALPHADTAKLLGSWRVEEMAPLTMVYEFQSGSFAMHGKNDGAGVNFELTMDADYRSAGKDSIWVIGTNPRSGSGDDAQPSDKPSIIGIQFTTDDKAMMIVSSNERFTLVRVH